MQKLALQPIRRDGQQPRYDISAITRDDSKAAIYISAPGRQVHHFLLLVARVFWGHMNMDCCT